MIRFVCLCGKKLSSQEGFSGEEVKCPSCGKVLIIPEKDLGVVEEVRFSSAAAISFILSLVPFILLALFACFPGFSDSLYLLVDSAIGYVRIAARTFHAVSFFFVPLVALILSVIARSRIRKRGDLLRGEVFASAAIVISASWFALVGALLLIVLTRWS
jgi:hypothetical protein